MKVLFKNGAHVDLCTQACGQQVQSAQLAVQEYGVGRRRVPIALIEAQSHTGIAYACRQITGAKIKAAAYSGRLGG